MKQLFLFCLLTSTRVGYPQTGFFLVIDNGNCGHVASSLNQTQHYCITKEPIISKTDFKAEDNLQKDPVTQNLFFILKFTNSGLEKLKIICERMTEKKLVFVVNGCAIALLDHLKPRHRLQIIFKPESRDIAQIVEALKKDTTD